MIHTLNEMGWRVLLKVLEHVEVPYGIGVYYAEWWGTSVHRITIKCGLYGIEIKITDGTPKWACPLDDPDLVEKAVRELARLGIKHYGVK